MTASFHLVGMHRPIQLA